jgi:hypothetical protein
MVTANVGTDRQRKAIAIAAKRLLVLMDDLLPRLRRNLFGVFLSITLRNGHGSVTVL